MPFELPNLPYAKDALAPHMSAETFDYHHGKHHQAYVNKLNELTAGKPEADKSLEELIKTTEGGLFNQAAQVWNHTFFWNSMKPAGGGQPTGDLADAINRAFGGFDAFKSKFAAEAAGRFGSGWAWLVKDGAGALSVMSTANAGNPLTEGKTPILTLDVWEHAYYIDYRNARPGFISAFLDHLVDWDFAARNLAG
ncbi:superoxide dismutase [Paraliomyxa miuraensis]|uniref:superoxide dismutase n=1 Tax=Paraliomyxa miuraensis TaxID=376150 RepID=UPI0022518B7A|nr:superoxide dismutase [Paraliomyxa miuraensis]MCX4239966.1 superoxide dismutase [Paraliomyxa miuraensis]